MSSDKQEASIPDQRKHVERYAREHGFRVVREYADEGISGDDTAKRSAFRRMVAEAPAAPWRVILCWDQDRFGRFDSIDAGEWIAPLRRAGIVLHTVAQGVVDWNDFAGRLVWSVQQEGKHAYLRDLSRNVLRGHITNALEGGRRAGLPPLGYAPAADDLILSDDAPIVRGIFDAVLAGKSLRAIARDLGVTRKGVPWSANAVRVVLANPIYKGTYVWGRRKVGKYHRFVGGQIEKQSRGQGGFMAPADAVVIENRYPAIVTPEEWAAAQDRLRENRTQTAPKPSFVFSGLCVCGHCGGKMHGQTMWGHRYYLCVNRGKGCRYYMAREEDIEEGTLRKLDEVIGTPKRRAELRSLYERGLRARAAAVDVKAERKRLASLDAKLATAAERLLTCDADLLAVARGQAKRLKEERDAVADRLAAAEDAESRLGASVTAQAALLDRWADALTEMRSAPLDDRRAYYRGVIASATLYWRTGGTEKLARHTIRRIHWCFRHPILGEL